MPTYNREQERIRALFSGDNQANFATWQPVGEQQGGINLLQNPATYNQQGSQKASRALLGETPLMGDTLKPGNAYQDALRRRLGVISGLSEQANNSAFAPKAAIMDPGTTGGPVYSGAQTSNARRNAILKAAAGAVGLPYSWGGGTAKGASYGIGRGTQNLKGFDCSGLVLYAYAQIGIKMSHSANAQARMGVRAPINRLQPGDLVGAPGHIAIYAGNGMMYEAPTFGKRVRLVPVRKGMFGIHFNL